MSSKIRIACNGLDCSSKPVSSLDLSPRGIQWVDIPDDYPDKSKAYCSIECALLDGGLRFYIKGDK